MNDYIGYLISSLTFIITLISNVVLNYFMLIRRVDSLNARASTLEKEVKDIFEKHKNIDIFEKEFIAFEAKMETKFDTLEESLTRIENILNKDKV